MRHLLTLPLVLLLSTLSLAACGGDSSKDDDTTASACATYDPGSASDGVKVTGEFGETGPKATFTTPLTTTPGDLQRTIVTKGDGRTTAEGDDVEAVVTVFNGRTGKQAISEKATLTVGDTTTFEAFRAALECMATGSRVVTTATASDIYGEQGYADLDIQPTDGLVIVTDLVDIREPVEAESWTEDVPQVTFAKDGTPEVTLPDSDPPSDVRVKVLKEGDGETVEDGDAITVNYQGRTWESGGKVFQQTWGEDGEPTALSTDEVVQGFKAGVVGQKVGSTVLIGIPAKYGYGTEESTDDELGGKTLVFVVEIVSIDS